MTVTHASAPPIDLPSLEVAAVRASTEDTTPTVSGFWGRVAGTFVSNVYLVVVGLVGAVLTARVLGPEGRGIFAVLVTVATIGVQLGNFGTHTANTYHIAADRRLLPALLSNSIVLGLGLGTLVAAVLHALIAIQPDLLPAGIRPLLTWATAAVPFGIVLLLVQHLFLGLNDIRRYNGLQVVQSTATLLLMVSLAIVGLGSALNFFIISFVVIAASAVAGTAMLLRRSGRFSMPDLGLLGRTSIYGFRVYLATLFAFLALHFDLLMVARMLGSEAAGHYSIAARMAEMIYLLPAVAGTMLFATVSSRSAGRWAFTRQTAGTIALLLVPLVVLAAIVARPVTTLLFGPSFAAAVPAFLWLLPGVYFLGVNTIFMQYFAGTGMPIFAIASPAAAAILNVALNLYLLPRAGIIGAAIASTAAYALMLCASLVYVRRTEGRDLPNPGPGAGEAARPSSDDGVQPAPQNIYGHNKRIEWILPRLERDDTIIELGCGTGYMLCYPLAKLGYDVYGVDIDAASIAVGQEIFTSAGLDPERLQARPLDTFEGTADVIIASEVLEHIADDSLPGILAAVRSKLRPGGRLIVTVPNGYGWFELEQFAWQRLRLGWIVEKLRIAWLILAVKTQLLGRGFDARHPSTLDASPHVQRFTVRTIRDLLERHGFAVEKVTGSVLFAGPFSHLLFTGIGPIMSANCWLGDRLPRFSSGFYVSCRSEPA